ncbi:MAG: hypothetical protein WDM85_19685 [Caulobacteraceae bacterium]
MVCESRLGLAEIVLAATCVEQAIERMPDLETIEVAGVRLPHVRMNPFETSATAKLRRALQHLGHGPQQAYQAGSSGGGDRLGTGDTL